jgi:hypothetical protein
VSFSTRSCRRDPPGIGEKATVMHVRATTTKSRSPIRDTPATARQSARTGGHSTRARARRDWPPSARVKSSRCVCQLDSRVHARHGSACT